MNKIKISKDIVIRHVKLSDAQTFFDAEQDETAKMNFMSTPASVNDVEDDIKEEIQKYKQKKPSSEKFTILYKGYVAGWIAINQLNVRFFEHRAKVDFCLHPNSRDKKIMTKVLKKVVSYAFKKYNLKRLEAWTRTFNKAVARLNEKAGFKLEGVLRKNKCKNGKYLDDMVWAIVK
jgi:[ribosomal protein S5]-alanine N-acetyltransferase